jgi:hypothetical protein
MVEMRRSGFMLVLAVVMAFSFLLGVSAVSAESACYRGMLLFQNLSPDRTLRVKPAFTLGNFSDPGFTIFPPEGEYDVAPGQQFQVFAEREIDPGETGLSVGFGIFVGFADGLPGSVNGAYTYTNYSLGPCTALSPDAPPIVRPPGVHDGRINDNGSEMGAPLAAYCEAGALAVYDISATGQGTKAFTATRAEIDAALEEAIASAQNVLIAEGLGNSLYALMSNELTLVGPDVKEPGKLYQRIISAQSCA